MMIYEILFMAKMDTVYNINFAKHFSYVTNHNIRTQISDMYLYSTNSEYLHNIAILHLDLIFADSI